MSKDGYFSFLVCHRNTGIEIYVCGHQLGVIRDDKFHPAQIMQGEVKRDITIQDIPFPLPFNHIHELQEMIWCSISKVWIQPGPFTPTKT